jgi:ribonuclease HI
LVQFDNFAIAADQIAKRLRRVDRRATIDGTMGKPKFYGVAQGRTPGVYTTWDEARAQVDGIKGAVHKSFSTREEAARWVSEKNPEMISVPNLVGDEARPSAARPDPSTLRSPPTSPGKPRAPRGASSMAGAREMSTSARVTAAAEGPSGGNGNEPTRADDDAAAAAPSAPLTDGTYTLFFDGASRGNPGPAGAGALIRRDADSRVVFEIAEYLGDDKTNNEAEYIALVGGLRKAAELGIRNLAVKGDSTLVVNQVNGRWKVKTEHLRPMRDEARRLIDGNFRGSMALSHVRREHNSEADSLANVAITVGSQIGRGVNVAPGSDVIGDGGDVGGGGGGASGFVGGGGGGKSQSMRPMDPWWGMGKVRGMHTAATAVSPPAVAGSKRARGGGGVRVRAAAASAAAAAPAVVDLTGSSDGEDEPGSTRPATGFGGGGGGPAFASLTASTFAYPGAGSRSWRWPGGSSAGPGPIGWIGTRGGGASSSSSRLRCSVAVAGSSNAHVHHARHVVAASRVSVSSAAHRWMPILRGSVRLMSRLVA